MRLLINGREARGPGAYVIAGLVIMLVVALLMFVVLPIIGAALAVAAVGGAVYVGARAFGLIGRKPKSDEAEYRVESSRPLHRIPIQSPQEQQENA
jgi:hypothetical protein